MKNVLVHFLIVFSLGFLWACGDNGNTEKLPQETCGVVGSTQSCICSNGTGSQSCLLDGSWSTCQCNGVESDASNSDILGSNATDALGSDTLESDVITSPTCDPTVESNCFLICSGCESDESSENPYTEDPNFDANIDLGGNDPARLPYGSVTGTYQGVSSYSNYVPCVNSPGCYYSVGDGRVVGTYGYNYQCVEYVVRFFAQALDYPNLNGNGNAKNWWYSPTKTTGKNLLRFENGGSTSPQPGDAIVFDSSGVGHIAVVREVGIDYILIIQQNWTHNAAEGNLRIGMTVSNSTYFVHQLGSNSYPVLGWLRVPSSSSVCPNGNGDYCGESVGQTAGVLYSCANGTYTLKATCLEGCSTRPSGENDVCNDPVTCVSNYNQGCDGNAAYYYDTCGNRGPLVANCSTNENCTITGSGGSQTASCEAAACTQICNPGTKQCNGLNVEVCSSNGCSWQTDHACSGTCDSGRCCGIVRVYPTSDTEYTDTCSLADKAIWRGKSSNPIGNNATFTFNKCPSGGGPSVDVKYWVVTGEDYPTDNPLNMCMGTIDQSCTQSCCRTSGNWSSSESSKSVTVNLWPNASYITPNRNGETKSLYIQTGGSDNPNAYWWHQGHAMKFQIVCDP